MEARLVLGDEDCTHVSHLRPRFRKLGGRTLRPGLEVNEVARRRRVRLNEEAGHDTKTQLAGRS
jgi:hypothetical protein